MTIEVMKQALEVLEWHQEHALSFREMEMNESAINALSTAIEEAEKQEPVAWLYDFLNPDNRDEVIRNWTTQDYDDIEREKGFNVRPLYTTPPAAPVQDERDWSLLEATQESLREHMAEIKRLKTIIEAAEKQEPVATYTCGVCGVSMRMESAAAQRQWVGLTDDEIKEIIGSWAETPIKGYTRKLFDQIEAKLKEKNT
jgi:rubrerythrin